MDLIQRFITEHNFEFTLFLTSLNSANQNDAQILYDGSPFCETCSGIADRTRTPHQQIMPPQSTRKSKYSQRLSEISPLVDPSSDSPYPPFLPSAGLTRRYLLSLKDTKAEHAALTAWCVEGDNRDDARALASALLHVLNLGKLPDSHRDWHSADQAQTWSSKSRKHGKGSLELEMDGAEVLDLMPNCTDSGLTGCMQCNTDVETVTT